MPENWNFFLLGRRASGWVFLLALASFLLLSRPCAAESAKPSNGGNSSEAKIREAFHGAEAVFLADIKSASLERMGLGGPPVPMSKVFFENVTPLTGKQPDTEKTGYLYSKTPDHLEVFRGHKVLVVIEHPEKAEKPVFIREILAADESNLKILESMEGGACSEDKKSDCEGGKNPPEPAKPSGHGMEKRV